MTVTVHAVQRMMQRAHSPLVPANLLRRGLRIAAARALRDGCYEHHDRPGQLRVLVSVLGADVWAILDRDHRPDRYGWTVVTVLTPAQMAERASRRMP